MPSMAYGEQVDRISVGWLLKKINRKLKMSLAPFALLLHRPKCDRYPTAPYGLCFAAGTLIHTKVGLKPIEQIQIGDWVLTQPEETGERTYKRVTRTTRFEDAAVWTVTYYSKAEREKARAEARTMPVGASRRLLVTPNHPFWVKEKGWVQVKDLWALNNGQGFSDESAWAEFDGYEFELADGQSAVLGDVFPLYSTETEGVAWQEGLFDTFDGHLIDLRDGASGELAFRSCGAPEKIQPDFVERWDESSYFRSPVFNFEVEDSHTYYVGTLGVWVHNINCGETRENGPGSFFIFISVILAALLVLCLWHTTSPPYPS